PYSTIAQFNFPAVAKVKIDPPTGWMDHDLQAALKSDPQWLDKDFTLNAYESIKGGLRRATFNLTCRSTRKSPQKVLIDILPSTDPKIQDPFGYN
ncbi:MAG: hypothetical protein KDD43_14680, partial [Bdellovibrionales bacterium]|nr:hypothetical protein [Bdellovibrionales bacterium]